MLFISCLVRSCHVGSDGLEMELESAARVLRPLLLFPLFLPLFLSRCMGERGRVCSEVLCRLLPRTRLACFPTNPACVHFCSCLCFCFSVVGALAVSALR